MAKRGRAVSIDSLLKQVKQLEASREALVARIKAAVSAVLRDGEASIRLAGQGAGFVAGVRGPGRPAGSKNVAPVARKKRKMSAAARKAISDAQKKRWAKQKAAEK